MSRIDEDIKRWEEKLMEKKKKRLLMVGKKKERLAGRILANQQRIEHLKTEITEIQAKMEVLEKVL